MPKRNDTSTYVNLSPPQRLMLEYIMLQTGAGTKGAAIRQAIGVHYALLVSQQLWLSQQHPPSPSNLDAGGI